MSLDRLVLQGYHVVPCIELTSAKTTSPNVTTTATIHSSVFRNDCQQSVVYIHDGERSISIVLRALWEGF